MMRQLVLDIRPGSDFTFDNFVVGENAELLANLQGVCDPDASRSLYLWGEPGSGRTHLLRSAASLAQAYGRVVIFIDGAHVGEEIPMPGSGLLVIDGIEALSPPAQIALFRAFNSARELGLAMVLSGPTPPIGLALREDLRTRVGQVLCYQVRALSDDDKADTFLKQARARGMRIEREIVDYLLRHGRRDLPSLLAMLDTIDRITLERQRPITLPLVRELLHAQLEMQIV